MRLSVGGQLLQVGPDRAQRRLFLQLAFGRVQQILAAAHESSRQGPSAPVWRRAAPDREHLEIVVVHRQYHQIDGHGGRQSQSRGGHALHFIVALTTSRRWFIVVLTRSEE